MYGFNFSYELSSEGRCIIDIDGRCIVDVDGTYELVFEASGGKQVAIPSWMLADVDRDIRDRYADELREARDIARLERHARDKLVAMNLRYADTSAASLLSMRPVFDAILRSGRE
jgi:hypothetical protein